MAPPTPLRTAIFNSGQRQIAIAKRAGMHESRLSKIAHGYLAASDDEKKTLARILRRPVEELFPEALAS